MKTDKPLGLLEVFCIASGAMISSGLFVLPSLAFSEAGAGIIFSYAIAGLMMIPALFSQTELATAMPKSGGTYFYIGRSLGPMMGNFAGLANWFSISLKGAFALVGMGAFVQLINPGITVWEIKLIAVFLIIIFTVLNLFSVESSGLAQDIMVIILLGILAFYIIAGSGKMDTAVFNDPFKNGFQAIFGTAGMVFIAYGGLTKVASLAGEIDQPGKILPRGMFLSFIIVNLLYLGAVAVTVGTLSSNALSGSLTPLSIAAQNFSGRFGMIVLSLGAILSFATTANASIMSASRQPLAMAKDKLLPAFFARETGKKKIPVVAILLTSLFMALVILLLDIKNLVKTASTMMLVLFFLVNFSVILMRESRIVSYKPSFKSPFYPFLQIVGMLFSIVLIFEMGNLPIILALIFFVLSAVWYLVSRKGKPVYDSALIRIAERAASREVQSVRLHDELTQILFERDNIVEDQFDKLIRKAIILDIKKEIDCEQLFRKLAQAFSLRLDLPEDKIYNKLMEREKESTTVLGEHLAIPHIVMEGAGFEMVIVRAKKGVRYACDEQSEAQVKTIFALAGSPAERHFHLQALMAIAQISQSAGFQESWEDVLDEEEIRNLILLTERTR